MSIPMTTKVMSAVTAHVEWIAEGMPTRDEAEQQRVFEICKKCPEYSDDQSGPTCRKCGCRLRGKVLNKIKLSTEHCPLGKW